ncbi:hypothetical protein H8A99_02525 [Bradyrhizobium sp. Arg68]|uniref:hypothetical protein n=1 Tax=Bradyrhizobium ivorense TaxID=2511166 RepID=UPI001E4F122C|nr:hypothetical protein [Bradyrhizobium ivorense]MCC8935399.1 hypothetical protein [Bradyrhizobium ivorense]
MSGFWRSRVGLPATGFVPPTPGSRLGWTTRSAGCAIAADAPDSIPPGNGSAPATDSGTTPNLEMFKSSYYADVSLAQRLALIPPELLHVHLNLDEQVTKALTKTKIPIRPA